MLAINYLCLHKDHQPDFATLEKRGWVHPPGMDGEYLERSLVKTWEGFRFQVVQHTFGVLHRQATEYVKSYTEIFLHPVEDNYESVRLKGFGGFYAVGDLCGALLRLEEELK